MALKDSFDQTYTVNTSLSKSTIVNTFKERIEAASNDKGWFTTKAVNYKNIQADEFRVIIKLYPVFFRPLGEIGIVMLHFEAIDGTTKIQAVTKPVVTGFWIILGFMTLFSAIFFWLIPGFDKYIFITLAWGLALMSGYINIAIRRYKLTRCLKLVLIDIGIQEALIK